MKNIAVILMTLMLLLSASGCAKKPAEPADKVLAKINEYELTVADFIDETRLTAGNKEPVAEPGKEKEALLDEIVTKKLLLQEAQRQNFDKEKTFMKEIERYWEQALIKLMVRKKMGDFSRSVTVDDREVRDEYDRLVKESPEKARPFESVSQEIKDDIYRRKMDALFDDWIIKMRAKSNIRIYKENL